MARSQCSGHCAEHDARNDLLRADHLLLRNDVLRVPDLGEVRNDVLLVKSYPPGAGTLRSDLLRFLRLLPQVDRHCLRGGQVGVAITYGGTARRAHR